MTNAEAFEFLPHTADIAVLARGGDLQEVFQNAALALFSVLTELDAVEDRTCSRVEMEARDVESLLVDWLNELLFLFETEGWLFHRFQLLELGMRGEAGGSGAHYLRAEAWGEQLDRARHRIKIGVKAVTYHDLEVRCSPEGCTGRVVFDV